MVVAVAAAVAAVVVVTFYDPQRENLVKGQLRS
jgi:predicted membrane-bound mannosyltransferase